MTTPAEAIKLYIYLRDVELKSLAEKEAEIRDAMQALEGFLLLTMQERNEAQIKTAAGVAFRSPQMRVKLVDRSAFLDYCVVNHDFSMITNHVSKDAVKDYMTGDALLSKEHPNAELIRGAPPGVEVTEFITCNVRKA